MALDILKLILYDTTKKYPFEYEIKCFEFYIFGDIALQILVWYDRPGTY